MLSITTEGSRKLLSRARTRLNESKQPATNPKAVPSGILDDYIYMPSAADGKIFQVNNVVYPDKLTAIRKA